ncbi:MAG: hypothetical protein ABI458_04880 [Chloroflexota bacterium]
MNDAHQRFRGWLTAGAEGDPPRDAAVHASVCAECGRWMAALDLLAIVDPGLASMPVEPMGREHGRMAMAVRVVGATAIMFSATILGVGVSQLIGVSNTDGPVAQVSSTPDQNVLGETATPQPSQLTTVPTTPQETLTPLGTPAPTQTHPAATPFPYWTFIPTPRPTAVATPYPSTTGQPTPIPTGSATPIPTDSPTETPVPTDSPTPTPATDTPTPAPSVSP